MPEYGFTILIDDSETAGGKQDKAVKKEAAQASSSSSDSFVPTQAPVGQSVGSIDGMFDLAREWVGHPYLSPSLVMQLGESKAQEVVSKRTNSGKRAIDCSGFAQEVLGYAGVDPPGDQTAEGLYKYFKIHGTPLKRPQKGALVFFEPVEKAEEDSGSWDAGRSITHVAFATDAGKILDSSGGRGVTERSLPPEGRFKYHYIMPKYKFGSGGNA